MLKHVRARVIDLKLTRRKLLIGTNFGLAKITRDKSIILI